MIASMAGYRVQGVKGVNECEELLLEMLQRAEVVKATKMVEPPLAKSDLGDLFARVESAFYSSAVTPDSRKRVHAVIETAARDIFNNLLACTTIEMPSFVKLWNLFDIISILSDDEQCDPALLFWLVEELLDSQTIAGCRKIFDYLESRRDKITAKHFLQKNLVILRSCNELLRRLSRAEEPAFCGRVFIFLFQSFPLGDKSSVNLRGEYHTENVTTFDELPPKEFHPETMDMNPDTNSKTTSAAPKPGTNGVSAKAVEESSSGAKGVKFSKAEPLMSADNLYPIFWALQQSFNQPKKFFNASHFASFKSGLEATMVMFKSVQTEMNGRSVKVPEEGKRGTKRKRSQGDDDLANAFNPKYLTSRDLFELEISDLSFRRHILVQVLIVMDFLLSLSSKAKEKLATATLPENPNKSVIYADQVLSDDDTNWALDMKRSIAEYLKQGFEGAFFYRMVETVLSRDKNWVRWKIENCPSIARPPISPKEYVTAKASARKATTNKRLRPNPLGSLDLKFLTEGEGQVGLERLKDPTRYQVPSVKSFKSKIELDDMDIDMARDEESKNAAIESKASKSWRALRIASATKLISFDRIERADKIDEIFQDHDKADEPATNGDEETLEGEQPMSPKDRRPIVVSGPSGVGKGTLMTMLIEKHAKVFGKKVSHTTRAPRKGEVHGQHYYFITKEEYDVLRDGDEFLELNNFNGNDYGTSRKVVDGIVAQGKVPIMEMDMHGIQQLKDQNYAARFIFLAPPDISELHQRLHRRGLDGEDKIKERLEIAEKELEQANQEGFHDKVFVNDDLQATFKELEKYIFGKEDYIHDPRSSTSGNSAEKHPEIANAEVEMTEGGMSVADGGVAKSDGDAPAEEIAFANTEDNTTLPAEESSGAMEVEETTK